MMCYSTTLLLYSGDYSAPYSALYNVNSHALANGNGVMSTTKHRVDGEGLYDLMAPKNENKSSSRVVTFSHAKPARVCDVSLAKHVIIDNGTKSGVEHWEFFQRTDQCTLTGTDAFSNYGRLWKGCAREVARDRASPSPAPLSHMEAPYYGGSRALAVQRTKSRKELSSTTTVLYGLRTTDGNTVTLSFFSASSFHLSSVFVRYSPRGGQHPSAITTTPRPASIIRFFSRGPPERRQMNSSSKSVNSCYPRQSRREIAEILQALVLCVPPS